MKIECQLITINQAKKLKELGIYQKSRDYFCSNTEKLIDSNNDLSLNETYSAFNCFELGLMLPRKIRIQKMDYSFRINLTKKGHWILKYRTLNFVGKIIPLCEFQGRNESELRANVLIYLLESGLTDSNFCNMKLSQ